MRNLKIVLVFLFALAVAVAPAWAQTIATANVAGTVTDPSGAVVPGADVTVVDNATNESRTTQSNKAGHYEFVGLRVGVYTLTVKAKGFRQFQITNANLEVGKVYTFDASLEVGATTQIVEVRATVGAELQTMNSTMGSSLAGETILNLPSMNRDVTTLLSYSPTSQPNFSGAESNFTAGGIGGQTSDQNTYILDGGVNTDDLAGNNGYPLTVAGVQSGQVTGAMPTPIESIEEFKVNTNNTTADFNTSSGGEILMTTKRGTNSFHGSAYDYLQNSALNSNDFFNNLEAAVVGKKPVSRSNRFGGSVGGPMLPSMLGGKTYFYYNYEGYRYPRAGPIDRPVPTNLMRQGILQFRDAAGNIVQYNLATSTQCGPSGGVACDPRGLGLNPVVSALWNQYEPTNYDCAVAGPGVVDQLNTCYYIANISYPLSDNFMVGRIDHDFGSKWRFFTTYRWFKENNPNTDQVDIGGLLPGDKLGVPASASKNVLQPRYFVAGLATTITPTLTNDFHFNYLRNFWQWYRAGAYPQCSSGSGQCGGVAAALEIGGTGTSAESTSALIPMNVDTQNSRSRLWDGHNWDYRDSLNWLKGSHFFQFGGEFMHQWLHFDRYDNVVGGLTAPGYEVFDSGINFSPLQQPIPCSSTLSTNCLPASSIGAWNGLYSAVTGLVDTTSLVATRSGTNLALNSLGTPLHSYDLVQSYSLYFSDAWKIKPNLTLSYGLSWSLQMPPYEKNREMSILTDPTGNTSLNVSSYFTQVESAANNGQAFNPLNTWAPIATVNAGEKYPYAPFYGGFGPRVSIAWSPGGDNRFFGRKSTVIRGGYARVYDRDLPINFIAGTTLGVGFLQSVGCVDPSSPSSGLAACPGTGGTSPATAFRIGVDGKNPPLLSLLTPTLPVPTQPGVGQVPYAIVADGIESNFRPGVSDQIDVSIQRQFAHDTIVELGYLGVWAKHLYQGVDMDDVPWMMKQGGQTFAQAYQNLYQAVAAGHTPSAQPFFETSLAASGYCAGFANCTAAVATNEAGNIGLNAVTNMWADLNAYYSFGSTLYGDTQCYYCYTDGSFGFSNYNALIMSVQKRTGHGLTLNGNATYGHALGSYSMAQTYTFANLMDPWNTRVQYGLQPFDRKFTMNVLGTYQLPFGPGHRYGNSNGVVKRLVGGWAISPIYSYASGTPNGVYSDDYYYGDQAFGEGFDSSGDAAVPMLNTKNLSNKAHLGITSNGVVGTAGDGFTNANLFGSNAAQVFNSFRQPLVGLDFRSNSAGNTRGQPRWNVDLGFTKDTNITERVHTQLYVQMFNAFNHMKFSDPFNSLADPGDFGVLETQYGVLNYNYTRIIQLGLRVSF